METIAVEALMKEFTLVLEETFEQVHGYYLDQNTSLFETLAGISAEEASVPVGGRCATLAAQVKHVAFYLDVIEKAMRDPHAAKADWGEIWRTVKQVRPDEWQAIQDELRTRYASVRILMASGMDWQKADDVGGLMAIIAHSAYHLGEMRQALCTLRSADA